MGDGSDDVRHPVQRSARVAYDACGFSPPCLLWVCGQHDITHGNQFAPLLVRIWSAFGKKRLLLVWF